VNRKKSKNQENSSQMIESQSPLKSAKKIQEKKETKSNGVSNFNKIVQNQNETIDKSNSTFIVRGTNTVAYH
jgi:hypothetical protein